ncbi:DUF3794 and LysM peptidoglycan-binding domain-containing protein [Ructibacterium gallinarum]|uniref:DUF3794 domain-containing protein n=1 Tax=Ructibacterium gallinarum TaxID=2779355 RepID=A0A9D5M3Z9_9FIRM|nr:SPOCS domain-containing protein [Ructibacterium gallinarum]MBE5039002.1 DUF3794 domain-containing protein [Ructibacterium gallinarum]
MAIQLLKQDIKTSEVVGEKYSQTMVESDVIVPDIKPDIKKVLEVSGNICITEKLMQQDKVLLRGIVRITVLYIPEGEGSGRLKSLSAAQEFEHTVDCRGAMPDMQLLAEAEAVSFDHTLINSRKLNLRCVAGLGVKVVRPVVLSLTTGAENGDNIAMRREKLRVVSSTEGKECRIIIREQVALPAGKPPVNEMLKVTAVPSSTELCMMENKAVAKGQVRVCALYTGEDENESIQFAEHILPFTEILDIEGAAEGMEGEVEYSVQDMYYEVRDDADGEARELGIEIVLGAQVRGSEIVEAEAVTDAYSLSGGLDLMEKRYDLEQLLDNSTAEISHKDQARVPSMLPKIKQVYDVNAQARIDRITAENGQVTAYGTVHTSVLYLPEDEMVPISGFDHNSEFSQSFAVPGAGSDTACDARALMEHVSYTLSGDDSLELRFVIGLTVKSLKTGGTVLVEDMKECEEKEEKPCPCIVLYFVQKGDTLWNIAKRYHTTVEELRRLNHIEGDLIVPGQQLKICRKIPA